MNVQEMISELTAEKEKIDNAILAFERLLMTRGRRRGRPPKWMAEVAAAEAAAENGHSAQSQGPRGRKAAK